MNDAVKRAEIKRYVHKAFLAKIMQMKDIRNNKILELRGELAQHGRSMNSSARMIGEVEIEEDCIADLLRQKSDLYINAYGRVGLRIGPDVLKDLAHSQIELTAARKSSLFGSAQLTAARTNRPQNMMIYGHLGKKASVVMKEIEASIDLYNLSHSPKAAGNPQTTENVKEGPNQGKMLALPIASQHAGAPTKETIWVQMFSWVVVGAIDLFVLGGGIAFMTSGHAWAADGFFVGGTALFLVKFLTWEEARRQPKRRKLALQTGVTLLSLTLSVFSLFWNHTINPAAVTNHSGRPAEAETDTAGNGSVRNSRNDTPSEAKPEEKIGKNKSLGAGGRTVSIADRVKIIIAGQLQVNTAEIKSSDDFEADLGANPADVNSLMRSLEQEYDISIPSVDSKKLHTVGETIGYIEKRAQHDQGQERGQTSQTTSRSTSINTSGSSLRLHEFTLILRNDASDPQFYINDQASRPLSYSSGIATLRLPGGSYVLRAVYPNWTCSAYINLPLEDPGPVPANCKLK
jgi:acyl carrier protein